jgi:hypothetical protein
MYPFRHVQSYVKLTRTQETGLACTGCLWRLRETPKQYRAISLGKRPSVLKSYEICCYIKLFFRPWLHRRLYVCVAISLAIYNAVGSRLTKQLKLDRSQMGFSIRRLPHSYHSVDTSSSAISSSSWLPLSLTDCNKFISLLRHLLPLPSSQHRVSHTALSKRRKTTKAVQGVIGAGKKPGCVLMRLAANVTGMKTFATTHIS